MQADGPAFELFDEWAASRARGEQPDPVVFLDRAGDAADELAALMDAFLRAAPRAEPSEETLLLTRAWVEGASPLVELRASRGIRRDDVVAAVVEEFGLEENRREKVKRYYHELESGLLDPSRLDNRLVDLIARTLHATRSAITDWRPKPVEASPAFRVAGNQSPPAFAMELPGSEPLDEVDRLFRSGGEG